MESGSEGVPAVVTSLKTPDVMSNPPIRQRIKPGVEHDDTRLKIITGIAPDDREPVMLAGCGDNQVRLGKRLPCFSSLLDQQSPLKHDVFGNRQHTLLEHRVPPRKWFSLVSQPSRRSTRKR